MKNGSVVNMWLRMSKMSQIIAAKIKFSLLLVEYYVVCKQ